MAKTKAQAARRRELRRTVKGNQLPWWRRALPKHFLWAALWVYALTIFASLIAFSGQNRSQYKRGQTISETIVSRVRFDTIDHQSTTEKQRLAREKQPAVYVPSSVYFERIHQTLSALGRIGADLEKERLDQVSAEDVKRLQLTLTLRFQSLRKFVTNPSNPKWVTVVEKIMAGFQTAAVLPKVDYLRERATNDLASGIIIRTAATDTPDTIIEQLRYDENLINIDDPDVQRRLEEHLRKTLNDLLPAPLRETVVDIIVQNDREPTYLWDEVETERRRSEAADRKDLIVTVQREPNQILIKAGTQLSELDLLLIEQEESRYQEKLGGYSRWLIRLGSMGLILLLSIATFVFVSTTKPRILDNPMRGLALVILILFCQGLATIISFNPPSIYAVAFSVIFGTMVLAVVYSQRFAMVIGAMLALLVIFSLKLPWHTGFVLLAGVVATSAKLTKVRNRSTVVLTGVWTSVVLIVAVCLTGMAQMALRPDGIVRMIDPNDLIIVALAGIVAGLVVQGILPGIEKAFKITTAMSLKDLLETPLLRQLAQDAPGTYQHSLRIADMAESAANRIGADALLCRVGALYHDVGKMNKPGYFIENQHGTLNKHDKLSPAMSLLIIVGHVKDGIEIAKEFKLPKQVRHFIESHHGTTLVEYFYHAARKKSEDEQATGPTEFEFRYPGPKPQSKEAAIMMLCDCVESAARSLPEPTPVRLEQLVGKMLNKRLMDGQFNECDITLAELHLVEQAVIKTITAIYHGRIAYPKDDGTTNSKTDNDKTQEQDRPQPAAATAS